MKKKYSLKGYSKKYADEADTWAFSLMRNLLNSEDRLARVFTCTLLENFLNIFINTVVLDRYPHAHHSIVVDAFFVQVFVYVPFENRDVFGCRVKNALGRHQGFIRSTTSITYFLTESVFELQWVV